MTDAETSGQPASQSRGLFVLLPSVLALVTHLPVLAAPLFWDDGRMLLDPRALGRGNFWQEIFRLDYGLEFSGERAGYYRPLFVLLAWILHQLFGSSAVVYHAISLVAFVGLVAMASLLFRRCFADHPKLALLLSCLFAVHPLNTDIVLFFTSLPDLVVAAAVAALLLLVRDKRPAALEATVAGLLALVAALFKESGFLAMAPLAGVLLLGRRFAASGGALVGLAIAMGMRLQADLLHVPATALLAPLLPSGSGQGLQALFLHAQHFFLPVPRVGPRDPSATGSILTSLAVLLLLKGPSSGIWWNIWKGNTERALWWTWIFVTIHGLMTPPALGLLYSERYGSLIPLIWLLGTALVEAERRFQPAAPRLKLLAKIGAIWVALQGSAGMAGLWQALSARSYWTAVLKAEPNLVLGQLNLARALRDEGDLAHAEKVMLTALKLAPEDKRLQDSLLYLAETQFYLKKYDAALATLAQRDSIAPGEAKTASLRAICLFSAGRRVEAVAAIRAAMAAEPQSSNYRYQFLKIAAGEPSVSIEELIAVRNELVKAGSRLPEEAVDEAMLRRLHGT